MSLKVQSLDELDPDLVRQAHAELSQLIQERHPEIELSGGVMHDLVAYFAGGVSGGVNQTEINRVLESRSLLAIEENPELADTELADHVFSNFRVTRKAGSKATGEIAIVVGSAAPSIISSGATFSSSGAVFIVDDAYTGQPPGTSTLGPSDRLMSPYGNGTYVFSVPATATEVGEQGNIRRNAKMTPGAPVAGYVTSYASTDFTSGSNLETNAQILTRMEYGIAAKVMQGRSNIKALLLEQPTFADTLHYSILGYGNPEMLRDQHGIVPISGGGRMDIYAKTAVNANNVTLRKTARYIGPHEDGGIWQFSMTRTDAPGFYEITQVLQADAAAADDSGYAIIQDIRGVDLPDSDFAPDIVTTEEAAYSRYQTAVIQFVDTDTAIAGLTAGVSEHNYDIGVSVMPLIAELQDFCGSSLVRALGTDVLVKGAVPCWLSINCDIEQAAGSQAPDVAAIRQEIAAVVSNLDFPGQLHSSVVADVIHNYLTRKQAVGPIDLHGRIRQPDGEIVYVRGSQILELPDNPSKMVTGRTVALLLDPDDIGLAVVTKGFAVSS